MDFLLEIGTEELPVFDLDAALTQLRERVPALLEDLRLEHGNISVMGTPRRLVVMVEKMASRQEDRTLVVKGPPAARAFDPQGKPTPAAEGFARSKGIPVEKLEVREMEDGSYVMADLQENGFLTAEVLQKALPELIGGIKFDKSIRWNSSNVVFSRPIRWLLALAGEAGHSLRIRRFDSRWHHPRAAAKYPRADRGWKHRPIHQGFGSPGDHPRSDKPGGRRSRSR